MVTIQQLFKDPPQTHKHTHTQTDTHACQHYTLTKRQRAIACTVHPFYLYSTFYKLSISKVLHKTLYKNGTIVKTQEPNVLENK